MIKILFTGLLILSLNSCVVLDENIKKSNSLIVQEMNTDGVIVLLDRTPNNFKSFMSYLREKIYLNSKLYYAKSSKKIEGKVNVSFMVFPSGNVKY